LVGIFVDKSKERAVIEKKKITNWDEGMQ